MPHENVIDDAIVEATRLHGSTNWETIAISRWGTYVSEIERATILTAISMATKPSVALDVGCDRGRWSQIVHDAGWRVICTDIYAGRLKTCKARIPSAKCILVDPESRELPCESGTVGLILGIEVPFVTQSNWFISEAYRVLQAGGFVVLITFNLFSWRGLIAHLSASARESYDYYERSYISRKKELRTGGFTVRHETGFCWFPFSRASNSPLIPLALRLERSLGLRKLITLSPWVACIAQKNSAASV